MSKYEEIFAATALRSSCYCVFPIMIDTVPDIGALFEILDEGKQILF